MQSEYPETITSKGFNYLAQLMDILTQPSHLATRDKAKKKQ